MVSRKPSSLFTRSSSSPSSSPHRSPASSCTSSSPRAYSWDVNIKDNMPAEEHTSTRPLTVAIPQATGPYCQRRPTLREILSNTSCPPWTLAAFMAYLSANLCLENLEFTMDAGRYQKHYAKMMVKAGEDGKPPAKDSEYVRLLWVRLIDAYIAPNGSREVNLPSNVRDPILNAPTTPMPPPPETLTAAVTKTHELMEESVLQPFLNSIPSHSSVSASSWHERSTLNERANHSESMSAHAQTEHSMFSRHKSRESPPPNSTSDASHNSGAMNALNRMSGLGRSRFTGVKSNSGSAVSTNLSNTSEASLTKANWSGSGQGMTDDSGSASSPTTEAPMTPPTSPPINDLGVQSILSPKHNRDSGIWKRLGKFSGIKHSKKPPHSVEDSR